MSALDEPKNEVLIAPPGKVFVMTRGVLHTHKYALQEYKVGGIPKSTRFIDRVSLCGVCNTAIDFTSDTVLDNEDLCQECLYSKS